MYSSSEHAVSDRLACGSGLGGSCSRDRLGLDDADQGNVMRRIKPFRRVARPFSYNGFLIELFNNRGGPHFKYEWRITAVKTRIRKHDPVTIDPTSHQSVRSARYYAKRTVNEIRSPFWMYDVG
jgi:hypothetical protein